MMLKRRAGCKYRFTQFYYLALAYWHRHYIDDFTRIRCLMQRRLTSRCERFRQDDDYAITSLLRAAIDAR